jgi:hypothetical protein
MQMTDALIPSSLCGGKNKKSLTLDPRMAEIYTDLRWNHLLTHHHPDEVEHPIQRALV